MLIYGGEDEKVSSDENDNLSKPFLEVEIKASLGQMEENKAIGPDNIPFEFYKACCEIIKEDILELFNDIHFGNLDVVSLNSGIITLLPKSVDATQIQ